MAPTANGRSPAGQFLVGNPGGPGNPHASKVGKLRSAMLNAVSEADIQAVIRTLIEQAKAGDVPSCKLLLDRCLGPPKAIISARVRPGRSVPLPAEPLPVITEQNLGEVKAAIAARIQRLIDARVDA
ncbi:MAG: hypothetical protein ACKV2Q_19235 [Planctomycetaceae bacterium]